MTYRERREARAERLREWADKRQRDANDTLRRDHERYGGDVAFNTQPGHIPERARVIARTERAIQSLNKADSMASRARGIEAQLDGSIYSDDPDAIERLTERITGLEAEREQAKAKNAEFRKANKVELAAMTPYDRHQAMPYPSYHFQNLSGNIKRNRDRLEVIRRQQARAAAAEEAGGVVITEQTNGYCTVTFAEKPDRSVLTALKAAGFRWQQGSWWGSRDKLPEEVVA